MRRILSPMRSRVGGAPDAEPAVLVGGPLLGGGGLVADERRAGVEGVRLEPRVRRSRGRRSGGSSPSPTRKGSARRSWSARRRGRDCGHNRRPIQVGNAIGEKSASVPVVQEPTRRMRPALTAARAERIDGTSGLRSSMRLDRARTSTMPSGNVEMRCWNSMLRSIVTRTSY
jgi:hypothetical protein